MSNILKLGKYSGVILLTEWLELKDFVNFELAVSKLDRIQLNEWTKEFSSRFSSAMFCIDTPLPVDSLPWASRRGISAPNSVFLSNSTVMKCEDCNMSMVCAIQSNDIRDKFMDLCVAIFISCGNLRELHTNSNLTNDQLERISVHCTLLRDIDFGGCINITESAIISLCRNCPSLVSLRLYKVAGGDSAWYAIIVYCRRLQQFRLVRGSSWNREVMFAFHSSRCWQSSPIAFKQYLPSCHAFLNYRGSTLKQCEVTSIHLQDSPNLPDFCPLLTNLSIDCYTEYGLAFLQQYLGGLLHLRKLELNFEGWIEVEEIDASPFRHILKQLESFRFMDCNTPVLINLLPYCTSIKRLSVNSVIHQMIPILEQFPLLTTLRLHRMYMDFEPSFLRNLTSLYISLSDCLTDHYLSIIGVNCPNLYELILIFCPYVTDIGVESLVLSCKSLIRIKLRKCNITMMAIVLISNHCWKTLKKLAFSAKVLTLLECKMLVSKCTKLRELKILTSGEHEAKELAEWKTKLEVSRRDLLFCVEFKHLDVDT